MMTRKDYQLIARTIHDLVLDEEIAPDVGRLVARRLAEDLKTTNPRFDGGRFREACFPLPVTDRVH